MISYLSGKPIFNIDECLILDVRGVGYKIKLTKTTLIWALTQSEISLWIHTLVREKNFDLYGFETKKELYFFEKLIDVSGVGPKSTLNIIGLASTDTLYQAIMNENIVFLSSVPGIGNKTAQRMCIELRDKLKNYTTEINSNIHTESNDVVDALIALGYSPSQAYGSLEKINPNITKTSERIRAALANLL